MFNMISFRRCNTAIQIYVRHIHANGRFYTSNRDVSEPRRNYDAIIIGGGHNGLVAAAYLQKSGIQTCVLEKRHVIGGAAVTEEIVPGFKFSRASYVLSLLRPHIYKDLELKRHGLKIYPRNPSSYTPIIETKWLNGGPRSLTLGTCENKNSKEIAKFSYKDAQNFRNYEQLIERISAGINPLMDISVSDIIELFKANTIMKKAKVLIQKPSLRKAAWSLNTLGKDIPALYEFLTSPAIQILNRWFESEPLRATLATDAVIGAMKGPDSPGSGYTLLLHSSGQVNGIRGSWGYPEGGMGAVTKAMAAAAASYGAHIFSNMEVSSIQVNEDGDAMGVLTTHGHEITAKIIISNATPHVTFQELLPENILPQEFKASFKRINYTSPVTKINVALKKLPNFIADPCISNNQPMPYHQSTIHINCESTDFITEAYKCGLDGQIPNRPMIEMVIPSSLDPTIAPSGCHVCLLFTQFTPYQFKNGGSWDDQKKNEYAKLVFSNIDEYAPGFSESIIGMEVLSPPDLEKIFGLTGGNIFHGALSLDQLFLCRPTPCISEIYPPFTPVRNLILCGSGTHPGGGVMGAAGHIAAQAGIAVISVGRKNKNVYVVRNPLQRIAIAPSFHVNAREYINRINQGGSINISFT